MFYFIHVEFKCSGQPQQSTSGLFAVLTVGQEVLTQTLRIFLFVCFIPFKDICSTWLSTLAAVQFSLTSTNSIMKPKCNPLFAPGSACDSWTQTCSLQMPSATSSEAHGCGVQALPWRKYTLSSSLPLPCPLSHKPSKPCLMLEIEKAETKTSISCKSWTTTDAYPTWGGLC